MSGPRTPSAWRAILADVPRGAAVDTPTRAAIDANWLVADIAGMFDEAEIKMLVRVARKVCAGSGWGWISDGYRRVWIISETQRLLAGEPSRIVRR